MAYEDGSTIKDANTSKLSYFYIIPCFGNPLSFFFNKLNNRNMNLLSIYQLGFKILEILEVIHRAGYIHNDISLDKINLG